MPTNGEMSIFLQTYCIIRYKIINQLIKEEQGVAYRLERIPLSLETINEILPYTIKYNYSQIYLVLLKKKERLNGFAIEQSERRFDL